jgi:hypothetical protein
VLGTLQRHHYHSKIIREEKKQFNGLRMENISTSFPNGMKTKNFGKKENFPEEY